jgi:hypothetical protein
VTDLPDSSNVWKPIGTLPLGAALGIFILLLWVRATNSAGWVPLLDDANLAFHEAGHPILGLFSQNLEVYGGTLGQLAFPSVCFISFWRKREPIGFALSLAWLFENFLNISRYMADARAQILPLVGGGEHDWTDIFSRWHVLPHNLGVAAFVASVGWIGIAAAGLWLFYRWYKQLHYNA